MTLYTALIATVEISQVMIPPIMIGFFVASVIRRSPYFQGSLGLRVTAIEYSLVEVANILMILMIFLFL